MPTSLIPLHNLHPDLLFELRYATADNFTGQALYPLPLCLLRRPVAKKLVQVQIDLAPRGLRLKIFDAYRPLSVQRLLWAHTPDPHYIAPPSEGSRHNRGAAVDLTLVDAAGRELPMGTAYDDFTQQAHRTCRDLPNEVLRARDLLEGAMQRRGFVGMPTEWWHFDDTDWQSYPVLDVGLEEVAL
ncbi:MAG: D-alanyl-D-alanine dipeptidase [Alphaproteobacteria bacterium CG_4_10_14_0_2_um_filter_63_37]|nr:MAG: hypothetical protein AUJ55_04090 [Proteobacteria bacterium CG1_02_64_396]PJA24126.1 MAG: D-alanyl-D-alanine dipeptidase [Alphaproteobacteria bacterium CG_4_10_14_0_2_um_filter_63_37]